MSLDPIDGNLTNLVHEDMLPNQIKDAHFLPIGESVPDGIKVLENSVSCLFFFIFMNPLQARGFMFERHFMFFYQGLLFRRSPFYFQFNANENDIRAISTTRSIWRRARFKKVAMIKAQVAGFIHCLMRSCNQRKILPIMQFPDNYATRVK
jgi:hypothetical protein